MGLSFGSIAVLFLYWISFGCSNVYPEKYMEGLSTEDCSIMPFIHLSKYRRLSTAALSWEEANACCELRTMVLHTPERADEEKSLRDALNEVEKNLGDKVKPFWTSGKWNASAREYQWHYGRSANPEAIEQLQFEREKHRWVLDDAKKSSDAFGCVGVQPHPLPKHVELTKRDCNEKRHFVCQTEPQRGGHDLNLQEALTCVNSTIKDYIELPNGMYFRQRKVRWRVARYCCESVNMTLAGNFMEEKKHRELYKAMSDILGEKIHTYRFWTSLNDLCMPGNWTWICGRNNPPPLWRDKNPDNYDGNEDCGEFKWLNRDADKLFLANDLTCDHSDGYICDKTPPCPKHEQWPCGKRPPRPVDPVHPPPTKEDCKDIIYTNVGNTSIFEYMMSDKQLTWLQAKYCLELLNCTQASFQERADREFFTRFILSDRQLRIKPIWTPATSWKKKGTGLRWPDDTLVDPKIIHDFHTHDDVVPLCGKIAYFDGRVAMMTENCVTPQYFVCRIITPPPTDPDPFNFTVPNTNHSVPCPLRATSLLLSEVCPNSATTIQRPNASQLEIARRSITPEELHMLRFQNRKLKETVIDIGTGGNPFFPHKPRYGFRLYGLAAAVYVVQCPDVPTFFIADALHYFHRLHYYTSQERTELLDKPEYVWTKKLMEQCLQANYTRFRTDDCGELVYAVENCTNYICPDNRYQFNITKYDPLVEIWWKIFELSHAVCFQYFPESYRMFHKYSQAVMDLFSNPMRLRMRHQLEASKFWERVLGPNYELYLINMDRCNEAVIKTTTLPYRLPYSTLPNRVRLLGEAEKPPPIF